MTKRLFIGALLLSFGIIGFAYETWRFETIPELKIRTDSLVTDEWQACAIEVEGTVVCWGRLMASDVYDEDNYGFWKRIGPRRVERLVDVVDVGISPPSACAALVSGKVACWGEVSMHGIDVGDNPAVVETTSGYSATKASVIEIPGLTEIAQVEGSRSRICVRSRKGEVACNQGRFAPPGAAQGFDAIPGFSEAIDLQVGDGICILRSDRSVACTVGELDAGEVEVVVQDADWLSGTSNGHSDTLGCAGARDTAPRCWQVVDGERQRFDVPALRGATSAYLNSGTLCGVIDSHIECLENSSIRRAGEYAESARAFVVEGTDGIVDASSGGFHTCATKPDQQVQCWGNFVFGTLGSADGAERSATPLTVATRAVAPQIRLVWRAIFGTSVLAGILALLVRRRPTEPEPTTTPFDF